MRLDASASVLLLALTISCVAFAGAPNTDVSRGRSVRLYELAQQLRAAGKVMTVTGPVAPSDVGITLMHEHLFVDWFENQGRPQGSDVIPAGILRQMQQSGWPIPRKAAEKQFFNRPDITLDMINRMRQDARVRVNYVIQDENAVAREVQAFQKIGGKTIVDVTPRGLGRDPERLFRFSKKTGISVVTGAVGWYRWPFHPPSVAKLSLDDLTELMVRDVVVGTGEHHVRAGIIGEIPLDSRSVHIPDGASPSDQDIRKRADATRARLLAMPAGDRSQLKPEDVYDAEELKALRAAARATVITGASLSIHGVDPWIGYLDLVRAEGADLQRTIIAHADYVFMDHELLQKALKKGVSLEVDYQLQQYATHAPVGRFDAILDGVVWAAKNGYVSQILLSQDLCNRLGMQKYGGGGFTSVNDYVLPYLRSRGLTDRDFQTILVENPRRLLTLNEPRLPQH
jgi:phosphotriesterase-related protein